MNIKDALILSLDQIISKIDEMVYLDDSNVMQTSLESLYVRNKFLEDSKMRPRKFSGIYEVERSYILMYTLIVDKDSVIDSLANVNTKHVQSLEIKEKKLSRILEECSNYIMNISSIIDTATYNCCQILNFEVYNYFGFDKSNYKDLLKTAQYRSTSLVLADNVFYEIFTGKSIVGEYYDPIYSLQGVINKVPRDRLEFKIHRLICLLIKMDRRELTSVLCRLLNTQIDIEDKIKSGKDTKY